MLRHLLWFDSAAGLSAGIAMLALSEWLHALYALPRALLLGMGVANLAYGTYSGWLASRRERPRAALLTLIAANATWAGLCWLGAMRYADPASVLGLMHLVGEGLFVGGLAMLEWRERHRLLISSAPVGTQHHGGNVEHG